MLLFSLKTNTDVGAGGDTPNVDSGVAKSLEKDGSPAKEGSPIKDMSNQSRRSPVRSCKTDLFSIKAQSPQTSHKKHKSPDKGTSKKEQSPVKDRSRKKERSPDKARSRAKERSPDKVKRSSTSNVTFADNPSATECASKLASSESDEPSSSDSKGSNKPKAINGGKKETNPVMKLEWGRSLRHLWHWRKVDWAEVIAYNEKSALQYPHCSICSVLTLDSDEDDRPPLDVTASPTTRRSPSIIPLKVCSPVLPDACFSYDPNKKDVSSLAVKRQTRLLVCDSCKVCVHASCYGISEAVLPEWKCSPCEVSQTNAPCYLCQLRGGALKTTTCNRWAHVACAMVIPNVTFVTPSKRGLIDISNITKFQSKFKCRFCYNGKRMGTCVMCSVAKCKNTMHVTCGKAAGAVITLQSEPYPFDIECDTCHKKWLEKQTLKQQTDESTSDEAETDHTSLLNVGDVVLARHKKNLRYYHVPIVSTHEEMFYSVDFVDGSFSTDLYPQDIVSQDCVRNGPPYKGQQVQVLWTDSQMYTGVFKESIILRMYTVKFDDNMMLTLKRDNIWHDSEHIPKHVSSKISVATERKYDIFYCKTVEGARKRKKKSPFELD